MPRLYKPIIVDVRMSDMGYWVVTISVSPWQRVSTMICSVGISRDQASTSAYTALGGTLAREGSS